MNMFRTDHGFVKHIIFFFFTLSLNQTQDKKTKTLKQYLQIKNMLRTFSSFKHQIRLRTKQDLSVVVLIKKRIIIV